MIIKNKKTLFPNDRDPRGNSDFDRFTTYPNQGKISDNKPITFEHDSQQRNYPPKSEEKKEKKRKKFVDSFISSQHKFHCSIPPEVYEGKKRKMKLAPNSIIAARNTVETRRSAERGLC